MSVKYAILGLLHYEDMHGYRIKNHLERNFGHMWTVNFGQIYPALKSMREEGLVDMVEVDQSDAPARKLYSITPKGKKEFVRWLNADPEKNVVLRDPFLLRFTFFDFGDAKRAKDMIDDQIKMYEDQIKFRREFLPRRKKSNKYVRLVSELGINFNEMMIEWLKHAAKEISKEEKGTARAGGSVV